MLPSTGAGTWAGAVRRRERVQASYSRLVGVHLASRGLLPVVERGRCAGHPAAARRAPGRGGTGAAGLLGGGELTPEEAKRRLATAGRDREWYVLVRRVLIVQHNTDDRWLEWREERWLLPYWEAES